MIQYNGKTAETVEEALDVFGDDTTVYICTLVQTLTHG